MNFSYFKLSIIMLCSAFFCLACTPQPVKTVPNLYDYWLSDHSNKSLSITQLLSQLKDADVIMVGEWHAHPAVHLFQAQLLAALAAEQKEAIKLGSKYELALSMEHFTRADQVVLNQYLAGEIGESGLIKQAKVWDNYKSDYRPLIEIARLNNFPVIAANAPRKIVKCIGKQGPGYLDSLSATRRKLVAKNLDLSDSPYRKKFLNKMKGMPLSEERIKKMFGSQLSWDATMAESIVEYKVKHPNAKILHVAGRFHVINGLGTGAEILKLNPELKIVYISASTAEDQVVTGRDYRLHVQTLPPLWLTDTERKSVFSKHKKSTQDCSE